MIIRASKHILNSLLRSADIYDHPYIISHFFNCLLGTSFQANPVAELAELAPGVKADRKWTSLTPSSLRQEITSQVESRFRYALPQSVFANLVHRKVLREISMRVGIQLVARDYKFVGNAAEASTPVAVASEEEKKEPSKKKKGKAAKEASKPVAAGPATTFHPEDILNIVPIVKSSVHKVRFYIYRRQGRG
jgi:protein TIF31